MVIQNIKEVESLTWHRNAVLNLAYFCLDQYKKEKKQEFLDFANWFMAQSKQLKKDLAQIT